MCGIAGVLTGGRLDPELLTRMTEPIAHRGPDDSGHWIDPEAGVGFGHRRLSIVDLSPHGRQPMHSACGRYVLTFNGEIYNHAELRQALDSSGAAPDGGWRGHSDTEVLLQAIARWGLHEALSRSVGMFAFALWDQQERRLYLVRDRFGEKPLYYGWAGGDFVFASEFKAIRAHPHFDGEISREALALFAARTVIPAPFSIYRRLFKLEPGCILMITPESARTPFDQAPTEEGRGGACLTRYWSYRDVVRSGLEHPIGDELGAIDELEQALGQAVRGQAVADVPVGAFLSGGIDSSSVVALYQANSPIPVRTFTIGFEDAAFNEADHARAVADYLGTVHHEHIVTVEEAREVIPMLPTIYDEPFADASQIPTFLVSRFARGQVTVALTGDGGDELFAGYNRHFLGPGWWRWLRHVPRPLRASIAGPLSLVPSRFWSKAAAVLPGDYSPHLAGKLRKGLGVSASARSVDDVYASFLDEWSAESSPVIGAPRAAGFDLDVADGAPDALRMMYCDAVSYLPDDILCKVDRASMAVSLETRVPFLDHRVAEVAARIPLEMKIRGGSGKHVLRQMLYRHAPRELFERPKAGFAIPVGEWIKGPLRPWAEELLDPARMTSEGWFDTAKVQRRWADHLSGRRESTPAIWAVLMFQAWLREQAR